MTDATIELAKNVDWKRVNYPVYVQEKFDGVPLLFTKAGIYTRQGELVKSLPVSFCDSIMEIFDAACSMVDRDSWFVVGEATFAGKPFKYSSGQVRRQEPIEEGVFARCAIYVFDCRLSDHTGWLDRYSYAAQKIGRLLPSNVRFIRTAKCSTRAEVEAQYTEHVVARGAEGIMLHDPKRKWSPGKRCWGLQRWKQSETLDLHVSSFEEAISIDGEPKGMVGRINVQYRGRVVGVGPGALTHAERVRLWRNRACASKYIVEVKFKPDDSYDALREASVVAVRYDKMETRD